MTFNACGCGDTGTGGTGGALIDNDGDGYYLVPPVGQYADCNDANALIHPFATEVCNGVDDDCEGGIDEGLVCGTGGTGGAPPACNPLLCEASVFQIACSCPGNIPGVQTCAADGCSLGPCVCFGGTGGTGGTGGALIDYDGDGYYQNPPSGQYADCDDANALIHPFATEVCNGIDDNCVGGIDEGLVCGGTLIDNDGDGYYQNPPSGQYADCNDANANIHPFAPELCNGVDDNCVGGIDEGLVCGTGGTGGTTGGCIPGRALSCSCPGGAMGAMLCNANRTFGPCVCTGGTGGTGGAPPVCIPGHQVSCACTGGGFGVSICQPDGSGYGTCFSCTGGTLIDNDGDGYYQNPASGQYADCNDANALIHPFATEVCNGVDDNCEGGIDEGNVCGTGGTGGSPATDGYATVTYTCVSPSAASYDVMEVYHEAKASPVYSWDDELPRTPPYGPLVNGGTSDYAQYFSYGVAVDGPNSTSRCESLNSGIVQCTVHVPLGSYVAYDVNYYNVGSGLQSWVCTGSSGHTNGSCLVRNGTTNEIISQAWEYWPNTSGCRFVYWAPSF
jgi:hypothetical protein